MEFPLQTSHIDLQDIDMENVVFDENEQVGYIQFNENELENMIVEDPNYNVTDLLLEDGTRAMIVNGTLVTTDDQAIMLQDENQFNQYSCEESYDQIVISQEQEQELLQIMVSSNSEQEDYCYSNTDISNNNQQFVITSDNGEQQLFYIHDPEAVCADSEQYENINFNSYEPNNHVTEAADLQNVEILDELNGEINLEQLVLSPPTVTNGNNVQYAIIQDGKIHLQLLTGLSGSVGENLECSGDKYVDVTQALNSDGVNLDNTVDLSQIVGRNVKTGQVITLSRAMDKRVSKTANHNIPTKKRSKTAYSNLKKLINRKIELGATNTGKKLIGKIVDVMEKANTNSENKELLKNVKNVPIRRHIPILTRKAKKSTDKCANSNSLMSNLRTYPSKKVEQNERTDIPINNTTNFTEENTMDKTPLGVVSPLVLSQGSKIIIQEKVASNDCYDNIAKTMSGLMTMDSVMRKLRNKIVIMKIIEKTFNCNTRSYDKAVSYCSGYMVREFQLEGETFSEKWKFIPDSNSAETIFDREINEQPNKIEQLNSKKYASVTIDISINEEGKRSTRVLVNPPALFQCRVCLKNFRTSSLLKIHTIESHSLQSQASTKNRCLDETAKGISDSTKHKGMYECGECKQCFNTPSQITKHMRKHHAVTKQSNESEEEKKPKLNISHSGLELQGDKKKLSSCHICGRQFSRYSNLQRHIEIHEGEGAMYQCSICNCSYHYISSLTRHIVSCHMNKANTHIEESSHEPIGNKDVQKVQE